MRGEIISLDLGQFSVIFRYRTEFGRGVHTKIRERPRILEGYMRRTECEDFRSSHILGSHLRQHDVLPGGLQEFESAIGIITSSAVVELRKLIS